MSLNSVYARFAMAALAAVTLSGGRGEASRVRFPALESIAVPEDRPTENMCSVTLRLRYGAFDYFTGGDMPGYPVPGAPAWHDVETDVAKAIGPTDVHVVNHHGSIEEENPFWLQTLRSRVMVLPAWSPTHPSADVLKGATRSRACTGRTRRADVTGRRRGRARPNLRRGPRTRASRCGL